MDIKQAWKEIEDALRVSKVQKFSRNREAMMRLDDTGIVYVFLPGLAISLYPDGHYTVEVDAEGE